MPRLSAAGTVVQASWVVLGPEGQAWARAVMEAGAACPALRVDGQSGAMSLRAAASTPLQRPSTTDPDAGKPAVFGMTVCEAPLPVGVARVELGGHALPVPSAAPQRILVLGDTGCRIKGRDVQACNDDSAWPFARIAAAAASLAPDLVIHLGDYHYRETPCPANNISCAGSPWGYGWDAWKADFFAPAAPLLAAAPWVFVRGNHEECHRAGQGWFRLLAPEPWRAERSCDDSRFDDAADFSAPYSVPLGGGLELQVFDSALAGNTPLDPGKPREALILAQYARQLADLFGPNAATPSSGVPSRRWFASHHPAFGLVPDYLHPGGLPQRGNPALQQALLTGLGHTTFPTGIDLALHGHVHQFQAIRFATPHAATLIAGHGGDGLDHDVPRRLPAGFGPTEGLEIAEITHSAHFGFLLLERRGVERWRVLAYRIDGSLLTECALQGSVLECSPKGALH